MSIGDIVVRKSYDKDITFKIIDIKEVKNKIIYVLKGINIRIIADANADDLEVVRNGYEGEKDKILNSKVSEVIKSVMKNRGLRNSSGGDGLEGVKINKNTVITPNKELMFGRPGKVLHIDGDSQYLETCLKVYKQLSIDAVGKAIKESEQASNVVELVRVYKPDIVVLTGHDSVLKTSKDYLNLNSYRNSKHYIEAVKALRDYNSSYDELVIFAGACQSCYESILDAGANFASSPSRVLIHCLDPVFICEKIAYTRIDQVVSITEVIENTITGIKGIGGLQTRGKYREGYPKSPYL